MNDGEDRRRIKVFVRVRPPLERLHERNHGLGVRCVTEYEICVKGGGGSGSATGGGGGPSTPAARSSGGVVAVDGFGASAVNVRTTTSPTLSRRPVLSNTPLAAAPNPEGGADGAKRRRASTPTATRSAGGGVAAATPPQHASYRMSMASSMMSATAQVVSAAVGEARFQFDSVFDPTCTQVDVYEEIVLELLDAALQCGTNVSLLCYGPTGSGKTYSMVGAWDPADPSTMGILPRAALQILSSIQRHRQEGDDDRDATSTAASSTTPTTMLQRSGGGRSGGASGNEGGAAAAVPSRLTLYAAELYLEELRDLFVVARQQHASSSGPSTPRSGVGTDRTPSSPRSPASGGARPGSPVRGATSRFLQSDASPWLPQTPSNLATAYASLATPTTAIPMRDNGGLAELCAQLQGQPIASLAELRRCYDTLSSSRVTLATMLNDKSSRSHALFILKVDFVIPLSSSQRSTVTSTFVTLADLAGSERLKHSLVDGIGVLEAQSINKSLSALCSVITALHQKQKHVPFRDSKLTRLLRPCLEGGRVAALIHVPPSAAQRDEALQTLKFAERMAHVQLPLPRSAPFAGSLGSEGGNNNENWHASSEAQQEGLEVLNAEARATMMQLAVDVRLANVAHGFLPRRLAALPLRVLQSQSAGYYAGWLHAKHVSESEAALGSTLVKRAVDHAMHPVLARIATLREVVQREVRVEADLSATAESEDAQAADVRHNTVRQLEKHLSRAQRARAAASQVKQLVQHRIGVAAEREAELRAQALSTKVQLMDANGSWHRQTARLDAEARLLQQETRNALVIQGLLADQLERLRDMETYLIARRDRGNAEGLCMAAQRLGFGKLTAAEVVGPRSSRRPTATACMPADQCKREALDHHQEFGHHHHHHVPSTRRLDGEDVGDASSNDDDDDIVHVPARLPKRIVEPSSASWWPRPLLLSWGQLHGGGGGVTPRPSLIGLYDHRRGRQHVAMRVLEHHGVSVDVLSFQRGGGGGNKNHGFIRPTRHVLNEPLGGGDEDDEAMHDAWRRRRATLRIGLASDGNTAAADGATSASHRVLQLVDVASGSGGDDEVWEEGREAHGPIVVDQLPPSLPVTEDNDFLVVVRVSCLVDPSKPSRHLARVEVIRKRRVDNRHQPDATATSTLRDHRRLFIAPSSSPMQQPVSSSDDDDDGTHSADVVLEAERPEALEAILFAAEMLQDQCQQQQQPMIQWTVNTTPTTVPLPSSSWSRAAAAQPPPSTGEGTALPALSSARTATRHAMDAFERHLGTIPLQHPLAEGGGQQRHEEAPPPVATQRDARSGALAADESTSRTPTPRHARSIFAASVPGNDSHTADARRSSAVLDEIFPTHVDGWLQCHAAYYAKSTAVSGDRGGGGSISRMDEQCASRATATVGDYRVLCNPTGLNIFVLRYVLGGDAGREKETC